MYGGFTYGPPPTNHPLQHQQLRQHAPHRQQHPQQQQQQPPRRFVKTHHVPDEPSAMETEDSDYSSARSSEARTLGPAEQSGYTTASSMTYNTRDTSFTSAGSGSERSNMLLATKRSDATATSSKITKTAGRRGRGLTVRGLQNTSVSASQFSRRSYGTASDDGDEESGRRRAPLSARLHSAAQSYPFFIKGLVGLTMLSMLVSVASMGRLHRLQSQSGGSFGSSSSGGGSGGGDGSTSGGAVEEELAPTQTFSPTPTSEPAWMHYSTKTPSPTPTSETTPTATAWVNTYTATATATPSPSPTATPTTRGLCNNVDSSSLSYVTGLSAAAYVSGCSLLDEYNTCTIDACQDGYDAYGGTVITCDITDGSLSADGDLVCKVP